MNLSVVIGHLGADAETRQTSTSSVVNFTVASKRKHKDKEYTDWTRVTSWGNSCTSLCKGEAVIVVGRMQTRSWESKDGKKNYVTELIAEEVGLVLRGDTQQRDKTQEYPAQPGYDPETTDEDSVPF